MRTTEANKKWTDNEIANLLLEVEAAKANNLSMKSAFTKVAETTGKRWSNVATKYYDFIKKQAGKSGPSKVLHKVAKKEKESNLGWGQKLIQKLLSGELEIGPNSSVTITPTELIIKF